MMLMRAYVLDADLLRNIAAAAAPAAAGGQHGVDYRVALLDTGGILK